MFGPQAPLHGGAVRGVSRGGVVLASSVVPLVPSALHTSCSPRLPMRLPSTDHTTPSDPHMPQSSIDQQDMCLLSYGFSLSHESYKLLLYDLDGPFVIYKPPPPPLFDSTV